MENVTLSIPKGMTLGLIEESGCGRSTRGRIILKLIPRTSEKIVYDSEDISEYKKKQMRKICAKCGLFFRIRTVL